MATIHKNPMRQSGDAPTSHSSKEPMIKPSHKGLLHKKLGVPQGQKIPESKLNAAKHSSSASEREEANFAENFGHKG